MKDKRKKGYQFKDSHEEKKGRVNKKKEKKEAIVVAEQEEALTSIGRYMREKQKKEEAK